jgi:anti-anti-sigma factor
MDIRITHDEGRVPVTIFTIIGDIDASTHEQLETQARQSIQEGTRYLLLDLEEVPYISSYGIRTISQIFNWLRENTGGEDDASFAAGLRDGTFKAQRLKLFKPSERVMKVLSTTGMDMFLEIHQDYKRAIGSF